MYKVVVTGPFNSGKSTLVRTLAPNSISIDARTSSPLKDHTTVLMDYGVAEVNGYRVRIFGTPGQPRFRPIIHGIISMSFDGGIFVVDSADPANIITAKMMYEALRGVLSSYVRVHVVAANKQDKVTAVPPERVRALMRVPPDVPVLPLVATRRESALSVLSALMELVKRSSLK